MNLLVGAICIPLGFWIAWRGLESGDYRRTDLWHMFQGVVRMLFGSVLATFGFIYLFHIY